MDSLAPMYGKFISDRNKELFSRFPGWYRAQIVDTNDPLGVRRVKFRCPELHSYDLKVEFCPWAVPAPWLGGKGSGSWMSPIINDIIWVAWEKDHPYGPIFCGFADGTRLRRYPLHSVFIESPEPLDFNTDKENPTLGSSSTDKLKGAGNIDDFLKEYLPKDRRPMDHGWQDRYGNIEVNKAVGFFPKEHEKDPSPIGTDSVTEREFRSGQETIDPEKDVNKPDVKYMLRCTSYGTFIIQSDTGYYWKRHTNDNKTSENEDLGEIRGDYEDEDELKDQIRKSKYLTKLFSEGEEDPQDIDQRRFEVRTRVGHKFEMRDVGWAQTNGGVAAFPDELLEDTKSREDEVTEDKRILSNKKENSDQRWMKLRSKGGHLLQFMDMGFHPEDDEFYKRKLIEECGTDPDGEKDDKWVERDARQVRLVTRYGTKIVLDDRNSSDIDAEADLKDTLSFANGLLLKTRRGWNYDAIEEGGDGAGIPELIPLFPEGSIDRGYGLELVDNPSLNHMVMYSPKSKVLEFNDKLDYVMMCTDTKEVISRKWQKLKENEFVLKSAMVEKPEDDTYHLKLDRFNGYIRLKTSANRDREEDSSLYLRPPELMSDEEEGLILPPDMPDEFKFNPGLEIRDGRAGEEDGAWVELIDGENRGIWLSAKNKIAVLKANRGIDQCVILEDEGKQVIIKNVDGQTFVDVARGNVQVRTTESGNITLKAADNLYLEGKKVFLSTSDGTQAVLDSRGFGLNKDVRCVTLHGKHPSTTKDSFGGQVIGKSASTSGEAAPNVSPDLPSKVDPAEDDRAKTTQGDQEAVDEEVIKGKIKTRPAE